MIKTPLSTVIGGVGFYTKNTLVIGGHKTEPPFDFASLFKNGEQGLFYDPHTLDNSLVGQTVPTIPDLSGNNNHGSNANSAQQALLNLDAATGYKYLSFDGIDDCYITQAIDLTHTSKVTIIAAVHKSSDANRGVIAEFGSGGAESGAFNINAPATNGSNTYAGLSRGVASSFPSVTGYVAPTSNIVRLIGGISENIAQLYIDSVLKSAPASNQGGGMYGNHKLFIGRRNAASLSFSGCIYGLLIIDRLLTDAEIQKVEKEFAKRMGITL